MRRAFAAAAIVAAAVFLSAGPAGAHAILEGSDPAPETRLDESPAEIALRFDEPVDAELGGVRLFDEEGNRIQLGRPGRVDGDESTVTADVPALADGGYVATWRVVSDDSHPVQGAFSFRVGESDASAAELETLSSSLLKAEGGSAVVGVLFAIDRWAVFLATTVFVGGLFFLAAVWTEGRGSRRAWRTLGGAWGVALVASIASIGLQGAFAEALPFRDVLDPSVWSGIVDTRFGQAALLRAALLVVMVPLALAVLREREPDAARRRTQAGAVAVVGLATLFSISLAGHATTGVWVPVAGVTDLVHLAGVAVWAGGLAVVLGAVFPPSASEPPVMRFSALAPWAMGAIVASGVVQAWRQVGSIDALRSTDYGTVLIVKLVFVGVLLVVAAVARNTLRDRVDVARERALVGAPVPAGPGAARAEDVPDAATLAAEDRALASRLRKLVTVEAVLAVAIFAVTAVLVNVQPARSAQEQAFAEIVEGDNVAFDVFVTPAVAGRNDFHATTLTPGGTQRDVLEMRMELTLPDHDIGPFTATSARDAPGGEVRLRRLGPGHYAAFGLDVPISGDWELTITVVFDEVESGTATTEVPIR